MYPHLFSLPVWVFALLMGSFAGAAFFGKTTRSSLLFAALGAIAAGLAVYFSPVGKNDIAVQGYGLMILIGFVAGVFQAELRAPQIGVERYKVLDMGLTGCFLGILGARLFYVAMNWSEFNPFITNGAPGPFDGSKVARMFFIWEGGLVFYGAFLTAIPWTYIYCRRNKLPALPFIDICAPGLIIGLAFGRIGCFLTGCCFGRECKTLPWAVTFPGRADDMPGSPAFDQQLKFHQVHAYDAHSLPVHPTQLYASLAAFLTFAFLYTYWPRRKYDGQILSLVLIMAGATRFFEEMLRNDDAPPFPSISESITIAQWLAIPIALTGVGMMLYFRAKNTLYVPPVAEEANA